MVGQMHNVLIMEQFLSIIGVFCFVHSGQVFQMRCIALIPQMWKCIHILVCPRFWRTHLDDNFILVSHTSRHLSSVYMCVIVVFIHSGQWPTISSNCEKGECIKHKCLHVTLFFPSHSPSLYKKKYIRVKYLSFSLALVLPYLLMKTKHRADSNLYINRCPSIPLCSFG